MAITAYTGLPGAGKSYEVVNGPILKAREQDRKVWTNIPVNIDGCKIFEGEEAQEHWYLNAPAGALIVIDECWRYWPQGMKADVIPEEQKEFFAMHRHRTGDGLSTDIVLVTQDLQQVAAYVRNLVEKTYRMRKLTALGTRQRYRVDAYDGSVTGQRPPEARHIGGNIRKYDPAGFARYRSHTQGGVGAELTVDKRGTVWQRPSVIMIPIAAAVLIAIPSLFASIWGTDEPEPTAVAEDDERSDVVSAPAPRPVPQPAPSDYPDIDDIPEPPAPDEPEPLKPSKTWTLLGLVRKEADGSGLALLRSPTGRRMISAEDCYEVAGDFECIVDNQVVAKWTGNGFLSLAQGSTYNKANQP